MIPGRVRHRGEGYTLVIYCVNQDNMSTSGGRELGHGQLWFYSPDVSLSQPVYFRETDGIVFCLVWGEPYVYISR